MTACRIPKGGHSLCRSWEHQEEGAHEPDGQAPGRQRPPAQAANEFRKISQSSPKHARKAAGWFSREQDSRDRGQHGEKPCGTVHARRPQRKCTAVAKLWPQQSQLLPLSYPIAPRSLLSAPFDMISSVCSFLTRIRPGVHELNKLSPRASSSPSRVGLTGVVLHSLGAQ
jgi:hypothetical protein